ncbi:MAG TPA: DUF4386 family protein [Mycobacteriales bacterium]|jgi:hypothetical protein
MSTADRRDRRVAAACLASAAGLAIAGFTALGSVFDYPQILDEPTGDILALYRAHRAAVSGWFLVLVVGAALLAPAGVLLGRLVGGRLGRWIAGVGIAAAVVQAVGLSRWVLVVPWLPADAGGRHTFELLHTWLGQVLGETVGYALTATFTVLVVVGLDRAGAPRWLAWLGAAAAVLIATGVLIPAGVDAASLTNFAGYVLWCGWLLCLSAVLWTTRGSSARIAASPPGR